MFARPASPADAPAIAFAATFPYSPRACYAGVAEFSLYVARKARGQGAGRLALEALVEAAGSAGFWKLVGKVGAGNAAARRLMCAPGFREVGIHEKHARLDGVWRDVVVVERLISPPPAPDTQDAPDPARP